MKKYLIMAGLALVLSSCGHHTFVVGQNEGGGSNITIKTPGYPPEDDTKDRRVRLPERGGDGTMQSYMPNATVFRMSGNYANNVAVTLSPEGELIYFPAPTDITADSEPVELCEGWWLNNQGLGPHSVFTRYTFAEYASLPEVPSVDQLKKSIIHGAKVTDFMELPYKIGEANDNIEEIKVYLKAQ